MIFVRFNEVGKDVLVYFVAQSWEAVLADTKDGTEFAGEKLTQGQTVSSEEVHERKFKYFEAGINAMNEGFKTYCLGYIN